MGALRRRAVCVASKAASGANQCLVRTRTSRFVTLCSLVAVLYVSVLKDFWLGGPIALALLGTSFGYTAPFVRLSNAAVYNRLSGRVYMNILDARAYHALSYVHDRPAIERLLRAEFVDGIMRVPGSTATMATNNWVVYHVLRRAPVSGAFLVASSRSAGRRAAPLEVAALVSWREALDAAPEIAAALGKKRTQVKVALKRTGNARHEPPILRGDP
jgi:hypothetical protein